MELTQVSDAYQQAADWAIPVGITFAGFCLAVLLVGFGLSKL